MVQVLCFKCAVCDVDSELRKQLSQRFLCDGCFFLLLPRAEASGASFPLFFYIKYYFVI